MSTLNLRPFLKNALYQAFQNEAPLKKAFDRAASIGDFTPILDALASEKILFTEDQYEFLRLEWRRIPQAKTSRWLDLARQAAVARRMGIPLVYKPSEETEDPLASYRCTDGLVYEDDLPWN